MILIVAGGWSESAEAVARLVREAGVPLCMDESSEHIIDPAIIGPPFIFPSVKAACLRSPCMVLQSLLRYIAIRKKSCGESPIGIYHPWLSKAAATTGWSYRVNPIVVAPEIVPKLEPHERSYDRAMRDRAKINGRLVTVDPDKPKEALDLIRASVGIKRPRRKASSVDLAGFDQPADRGLAC